MSDTVPLRTVFTGIHLHTGAVSATVTRLSDHSVLCRAVPRYGKQIHRPLRHLPPALMVAEKALHDLRQFIVAIDRDRRCLEAWDAAPGEKFRLSVTFKSTSGLSESISPLFSHVAVMGYVFVAATEI